MFVLSHPVAGRDDDEQRSGIGLNAQLFTATGLPLHAR